MSESFKDSVSASEKNDAGDSRAYFEEVAGEWATLRKSFFPDAIREAVLAASGPEEVRVAADVGAGSGFLTEALLTVGAQVIAVDRSEAMLANLRSRFPGANVEPRLGDAEALPLESGSVDCAAANMYLHHVDDPQAALAEMVRILAPGGRLVITDIDHHEYDWVLSQYHDRWPGFRREDMRSWLEACGLQNVTVIDAGHDCQCASEVTGEPATLPMFLARGVK